MAVGPTLQIIKAPDQVANRASFPLIMESWADSLYEVIITIISLCAIFANAVFLLVTSKTKHASIGSFRYLLNLFALLNVAVAAFFLILVPRSYSDHSSFVIYSRSLADYPPEYSTHVLVAFFLVLAEYFPLLSFLFLHRFVAVCRPRLLRNCSRCVWVSSALAANLSFSFLLFIATDIFYPHNAFFANAENFRDMKMETEYEIPLVGIRMRIGVKETVQLGLVLPIILVIFRCSRDIVHRLKSGSMFPKPRKQHKQFFLAVVVQASLFSVLVFFPLLISVVVATAGLHSNVMGSLQLVVLSLFPLLSPIAILSTIALYRVRLLSFMAVVFGCRYNGRGGLSPFLPDPFRRPPHSLTLDPILEEPDEDHSV